jgi:hypothetical protein
LARIVAELITGIGAGNIKRLTRSKTTAVTIEILIWQARIGTVVLDYCNSCPQGQAWHTEGIEIRVIRRTVSHTCAIAE